MRIAVLSTCQAAGLSDAIRALVPASDVTCYDMSIMRIDDFARDHLADLPTFDLVYGRLGFFTAFAREIDAIAAPYDALGIDIGPALARWRAAGCFMHSPNHPHRHILQDLARAALRSADIEIAADADLTALPDTLARLPRFPIYPELAATLGVEGSLMFKPCAVTGQSAAPLDLETFVGASFDVYASLPKEALHGAIGVARALRTLDR